MVAAVKGKLTGQTQSNVRANKLTSILVAVRAFFMLMQKTCNRLHENETNFKEKIMQPEYRSIAHLSLLAELNK